MTHRILPLLLFVVATQLCSGADTFPMRWRVFCDYADGVCFRYPYNYYIPEQYIGGLSRNGGFQSTTSIGREMEIDGKKVMVFEEVEKKQAAYDVRCMSGALNDLPSDLRAKPLAEVADHLAVEAKMIEAGSTIEWKSYNYYNVQNRPHGDVEWAPVGIEAVIGEGSGVCGVALKHGQRVSALLLTGGLTDHDNQAIVDSFEVLATKGKDTINWREGQTRQGRVINADGKPQKVDNAKIKPLSWARGWEIETKHYHVTTQVSPQKLMEYGAFLEGLYKAYADVYDPDQIPPYKMEIHVFNTWSDFASGAAANGIPVGPTTGGFFVPSLLSIFAFQDTFEHFRSSSFTLEVVLAHECSHQFLHCTCNGSEHVPTWLNEGLAVYFEHGKFQGGKFQIMSPTDRINRLKAEYGRNKATLMPLDQYLNHYGHISPDQYAEVYAMTHFWIFGSESGKKRFKEYWLALKAGESGTDSFERIFMADMIKVQGGRDEAVQKWQAALLEYVKRLK